MSYVGHRVTWEQKIKREKVRKYSEVIIVGLYVSLLVVLRVLFSR